MTGQLQHGTLYYNMLIIIHYVFHQKRSLFIIMNKIKHLFTIWMGRMQKMYKVWPAVIEWSGSTDPAISADPGTLQVQSIRQN